MRREGKKEERRWEGTGKKGKNHNGNVKFEAHPRLQVQRPGEAGRLQGSCHREDMKDRTGPLV